MYCKIKVDFMYLNISEHCLIGFHPGMRGGKIMYKCTLVVYLNMLKHYLTGIHHDNWYLEHIRHWTDKLDLEDNTSVQNDLDIPNKLYKMI